MCGEFFISAEALAAEIGTADAPILIDVRRHEALGASDRMLPTARWRHHQEAQQWAPTIPQGARVVVYCDDGQAASQSAAATLRAQGAPAQVLVNGFSGWERAKLLTMSRSTLPGRDEKNPSRWVTRTRPKIDRIACPWLIRRFIDRDAQFLFVAPNQVLVCATELDAIPYDVEGVAFTHVEDGCTFDTLLDAFRLDTPSLRDLAVIVRGADTGRPDLASQAAGLLAMSLGLSALSGEDDRRAIDEGALFYDALYAWLNRARQETHGWPPKP